MSRNSDTHDLACRNAKSWELRATTSFARLLAKQGRRDAARHDARGHLRLVHQGFDTADLKGAKALLEQLGTQLGGAQI